MSDLFTSGAAYALKATLEAMVETDEQLERGLIHGGPITIPAGQSATLRWMKGRWHLGGEQVAPVCECGVKFTGGRHSDWCPCHE